MALPSGVVGWSAVYGCRNHLMVLTLNAPANDASENVVCLSRLLHIFDGTIGQHKYRGKHCGTDSLIWIYTVGRRGFKQTTFL